VDPDGQATGGGVDQCSLPDLRGIPLAQLAKGAADSQDAVANVLSRIVYRPKSPSSVKATMFNSAI
jgi:FXSXX-COOH protein